MGEKKCKLILPRNKMRGKITEFYFNQTLSIYKALEFKALPAIELTKRGENLLFLCVALTGPRPVTI